MFLFIGEFGLLPAYIVATRKYSGRNKRSKKNSGKSVKNTKKSIKDNGHNHLVNDDLVLSR